MYSDFLKSHTEKLRSPDTLLELEWTPIRAGYVLILELVLFDIVPY